MISGSSSMEQNGDTAHHICKLMTMDTFFFLSESISMVHFYRVDKEAAEDPSDKLERAMRELQARVHRLLRTHAFLAGRIISHDDGMMMATCPTIGETLPDAKFREFIGEQYALRLGMSQAEMRRRVLDRALIKCARDCVDKDEPLFAVSVVAESRSASHFAVITSMSHGIADGRTFSEVLNVLGTSLSPTTKTGKGQGQHYGKWVGDDCRTGVYL